MYEVVGTGVLAHNNDSKKKSFGGTNGFLSFFHNEYANLYHNRFLDFTGQLLVPAFIVYGNTV